MSLSRTADEVRATQRAFRVAIDGERSRWRDERYRQVAERKLEPIADTLGRFAHEVMAAAVVAERARRRLEHD